MEKKFGLCSLICVNNLVRNHNQPSVWVTTDMNQEALTTLLKLGLWFICNFFRHSVSYHICSTNERHFFPYLFIKAFHRPDSLRYIQKSFPYIFTLFLAFHCIICARYLPFAFYFLWERSAGNDVSRCFEHLDQGKVVWKMKFKHW